MWSAYCEGYTDFYINCENGIPLWSAEIICALKRYNNIHLHIVVLVPYENQCINWSEDLRDRYYSVHKKADSITFVNTGYQSDCYNEADEIMVVESDMLIVFGSKPDKLYATQYAKNMDITIRYI